MDVVRKKELKIKVIDFAAAILPVWEGRLAAASKNVLEAKGVQIITEEKIRIVTSNFLEAESGKKIESDCTIWTAGVKCYGLPIVPEVERTNAGRIVVDEYSRIPAFENAFAIGDITAFRIVDSQGGRTIDNKNISPQLAQFAGRQASFIAKNIAKKEKGHKMIDKLTFSQRSHAILLGNTGLGLLNGLIVTGKMCEYAEGSIVDNFVTETRKKRYIFNRS